MDVIEHVRYPGVYLSADYATVEIFQHAALVARYGFHLLNHDEICAAVMLRVCALTSATFGDTDALSPFSALIISAQGHHYLGYDPALPGFHAITKYCYHARNHVPQPYIPDSAP